MEDLNKTQLILLALLVSFVTSIATGIVTVSLVNQAPPSVTQTINRVIEKTEQIIVPGKTQTITERIVVKEEDSIVGAIQKNSSNVVRIGFLKEEIQAGEGFGQGGQATTTAKKQASLEALATGFVLSPDDGIIVVPSTMIEETRPLVIETFDGLRFSVLPLTATIQKFGFVRIQEQINTAKPLKEVFKAVEFTDSDMLEVGQSAIALGANGGLRLLKGVISHLDFELLGTKKDTEQATKGAKRVVAIYTTLSGSKEFFGGPLLGTNGAVMGISAPDLNGYGVLPSNLLLKTLEEIRSEKKETARIEGEANTAAAESSQRP